MDVGGTSNTKTVCQKELVEAGDYRLDVEEEYTSDEVHMQSDHEILEQRECLLGMWGRLI